MVKCFLKECQFNCLPQLISLDSRKQANLSGGPCSLDSARVSGSMLHSLAAFSTLCAHDVNSLLLLPLKIFIEFNVDCCNACVWSPKIWLCKLSIIFELFGLCVAMVLARWLPVLGVFLTVGGNMLASNLVVCITAISIWMKMTFWPFRMLVVPQ